MSAECQYCGAIAMLQLKLARQQPLRTNALTFLTTDQCQLIRITDIHRVTGKSPGRPCLLRPPFAQQETERHNYPDVVVLQPHREAAPQTLA
jgi:hypothetical protein